MLTAAGLALAGCSDESSQVITQAPGPPASPTVIPPPYYQGEQVNPFHIKIRDGKWIDCVRALGYHGDVSISCDWDHPTEGLT